MVKSFTSWTNQKQKHQILKGSKLGVTIDSHPFLLYNRNMTDTYFTKNGKRYYAVKDGKYGTVTYQEIIKMETELTDEMQNAIKIAKLLDMFRSFLSSAVNIYFVDCYLSFELFEFTIEIYFPLMDERYFIKVVQFEQQKTYYFELFIIRKQDDEYVIIEQTNDSVYIKFQTNMLRLAKIEKETKNGK